MAHTGDVTATVTRHLNSIRKATLQSRLLNWYDTNARSLPWRHLWQAHQNPYPVWISEIMLQQTVIKAVLPVYDRFMRALPNVEALAHTDDDTVRMLVRGLGYYRRFRFMHQAAKVLTASGRALWPKNYKEWLELPGIGEYTASAISSITLNAPRAVVDGNVERVFCRLFDIRMPPNSLGLKPLYKQVAQALLNTQRAGDYNQAMMELGQLVCTPTKPDCQNCPITEHCLAFANHSQDEAPQPKIKTASIDMQLRLCVAVRDGKIGLWRRPHDSKFLRDTLGFITHVQTETGRYAADGSLNFDVAENLLQTIGHYKHSITKHRIKAQVAAFSVPRNQNLVGVEWLSKEKVEASLVANLDRKAWMRFLKAGYGR